MNWFYEYNGEQKGPVTEAELDRLIAEGTVLPTTLVWRDGLPSWTPLAQARATGMPRASFTAAPGTTQCQSCGRYFGNEDVVQIAGRNICAACKPAVLQGLQQGAVVGGFSDPGRTGPAWEHRQTLGTWVAARDTIKGVLFEPSLTFSTMKVEGGIGNPFWFNLIFAGIGNVILYVVMASVQFAAGSFNPAFREDAGLAAGMGMMVLIFQIVWSFVAVALGTFIQTAIIHVCLMICGGARRPFEASYRAIAYGAGGVAVLNVIPVLGTLAAIPWSIVVLCIGLARTHETDLWRVVLAIFLPAIVCCVVLAVIFGIVGIASSQ